MVSGAGGLPSQHPTVTVIASRFAVMMTAQHVDPATVGMSLGIHQESQESEDQAMSHR